jgi:spermidine/putrescine transport system ATP-binding protein
MEDVTVSGALDCASFSAADGSFISLFVEDEEAVEPIARTLAGLARPDSGRLFIDNVDAARLKPSLRGKWLALMPGDPRGHLVSGFTVMENMSLAYAYGDGRLFRNAPGGMEAGLFRAALAEMGMAAALDVQAAGLMPEQGCLAALRMALLAQPKALVVVEPRVLTSARSRAYLRAVWKFTRVQLVTTVLVTPGEDAAKAFGDRCYRVSAGRIILEPIAGGAASLL